MRHKRIPIVGKNEPPTKISTFRKKLLTEGFDLVDVTQLCQFKLGQSGWCNDFNEPDESCYHIQVWYRDEQIATFNGKDAYAIDDTKYNIFLDDEDFIIFRKVKNG